MFPHVCVQLGRICCFSVFHWFSWRKCRTWMGGASGMVDKEQTGVGAGVSVFPDTAAGGQTVT